jgi:hypothetical protein
MKHAWVYFDTSKQVGDEGYLKIFENAEAARVWLMVNEPKGAAFEYPVIPQQTLPISVQPINRSSEMNTPEIAIWAVVVFAVLTVVGIVQRGDGMPKVEN